MHKLFSILITLIAYIVVAQSPTGVRFGSTVPTRCGTADTFYKVGANEGLFVCSLAGVFTRVSAATVLSFGADSSGASDSTSAFTADNAVNNLVIVPAFGVYKINGWVPLANTIVECSFGATIKRSTTSAVITASNANVYFHGCTLDGNGQAGNLADITAANVWFDHGGGQNSLNYGIFFHSGGNFGQVTNAKFSGNHFASIVSDGSSQGGIIIGNKILQDTGDASGENKGIQLHATSGSGVMQDWVVNGNVIEFTAGGAMCIEWWRAGGSADITINYTGLGNTCHATANIFEAFSMAGAINATLTGNTVNLEAGNGNAVIEVTASRHVDVGNNAITSQCGSPSTASALVADKTADVNFHDNVITACLVDGQFLRNYGDVQFGEEPLAYRTIFHHNTVTFLDGSNGQGVVAGFCNAAQCTGNDVTISDNYINGLGGSGQITSSGSTVTFYNGNTFRQGWVGRSINIGGLTPGFGSNFTIASVASDGHSLTTTTSVGTNTTPTSYLMAYEDGSICIDEGAVLPNTVSHLVISNNHCININNGINRTPNIGVSYLLNNYLTDNVVSAYTGAGSGGEIRIDPDFGQYSTPGQITLTITGATNATPIVVTTYQNYGGTLTDGMPITILGVNGNTNANGNYFAKVTGFTANTFALYSDVGLTTPVAGNATYVAPGGWVNYSGSSYFEVRGPLNSIDFSGILQCQDNTGNLNVCGFAANANGIAIGPVGIAELNYYKNFIGGRNSSYDPGTVAPGASATVDVGAFGCKNGSSSLPSSFSPLIGVTGIVVSQYGYADNVSTTFLNTSLTPWTPGPGILQVTCITYGP